MEQIEFPPDFSEFLKSLTDHGVEFLLVGGFAVALHGYPRATADMDVSIARSHDKQTCVRSRERPRRPRKYALGLDTIHGDSREESSIAKQKRPRGHPPRGLFNSNA